MACSMLLCTLLLLTISALPCLGYFNCENGPGPNQHCVLQFDSEYFQCNDGNCICRASRCDGNPDCPDTSDEASTECDAILAGVIGGVAGLALLCCIVPCICCLCYCMCRRRRYNNKKKKSSLAEDIITPSHSVSAMNHVSLSGQPSSDIRADMSHDNNGTTTEV